MGMSNQYKIYTAGDYVGVSLAAEVVTFGVEFGVIKKGGAWYTLGEQRFQGEAKVIRHLRDNPKELDDVYSQVMAKVGELK